jgi:GNAT superfamily N-acetyltransferase
MADIQEKNVSYSGKRLTIEHDGQEIGRISVAFIKNDLHEEPYALIEDLFVDESYRGKGYARELFERAIEVAREFGSYKIIANSRYSREKVHDFYLRLGFNDYGKEFRLDLK